MIGLLVVAALGVALLLAGWVFVWAYRAARRSGKSDLASFTWASLGVIVLSLPIPWDAIPTWIAFEYYKKDAGLTVFKTLEQWKLENPGVVQTLVPYGVGDPRLAVTKLGENKFRNPINDRFAYDETRFDKLFLTVTAYKLELTDTKTEDVLVKYVIVRAGNAGGFAGGGSGWWAVWLVNSSARDAQAFFDFIVLVKQIGVAK